MNIPQRFSLKQRGHEFVIYDAEKKLPPTPFQPKLVALAMLSQFSQIFTPQDELDLFK